MKFQVLYGFSQTLPGGQILQYGGPRQFILSIADFALYFAILGRIGASFARAIRGV